MDVIRTRQEEREYLRKVIAEWKRESFGHLLKLASPNEDLEYRGVMRFFFQDAGANMAQKCVRVTSGEKCGGCHKNPGRKISPGYENAFESNYSLYEFYQHGDSRKLSKEDRPLVVQLSWQKDGQRRSIYTEE
ncbi:Mllt4p [Desmophyllum pertusum]|uniref:Mllt4p n=1 Tax=Desmophyllum pertusum TaxID=174260 RepID=A0A9X0A6R6_9CNID|nr:Mllt4p [Desmophyllum pertusum]